MIQDTSSEPATKKPYCGATTRTRAAVSCALDSITRSCEESVYSIRILSRPLIGERASEMTASIHFDNPIRAIPVIN